MKANEVCDAKIDNQKLLNPKITIGLCVRNCQEYVYEAVKIIARQDFPHDSMNLIFVDDGSEDNTLSIIERSVAEIDIPAKILKTSWKGLGHARNMVVDNSKGDYILWVDGDMVLSSSFVRKLVELMEKNPELGIAKGKQSLQLGANMLSTLEAFSRASGRMVNYKSKKARSKALGTGGSIYRVAAIKKVGGFDDNLRGYGEDWDIEIRIRDAGWSLHAISVEFFDYERYRLTWSNLWKRYWLRGYYSHYFLHKNNKEYRNCICNFSCVENYCFPLLFKYSESFMILSVLI